jgi:hypothetical protein
MKNLGFIVLFVLSWSLAQEDTRWFLGEWQAEVQGSSYTLRNNSDGSYYFSGDDGISLYEETGTWQLSGNQLTQNWADPITGLATSASYRIEKLSDTAFNQSGGNLPDGFIFSFTKVPSNNPLDTKPLPSDTTPSDPLGQLEDILSDPPSEPSNPLSAAEDTATTSSPESPTPDVTTAPPPDIDPTVTRAWLIGEWVARRTDGLITYWTNREDGTYSIKVTNLRGETVASEEGTWSLEATRFTQSWQDATTGETRSSDYTVERTSEEALRFMGGNLGLYSTLYNRVAEVNGITPVNSWLVGNWWTILGLENITWTFHADGSYKVLIDSVSNQDQTGRGTWRLNKDTLELRGDFPGSYTVQYLDDFSMYFVMDGETQIVQKAEGPPYDPLKPLQFAGQYIQENSTLTISYDGSSYGGSWLQNDQLYDLINVQTEGDKLSFIAKGADGQEYPHTFRLGNNGLHEQGDFLLNSYFQKISESRLEVSSELLDNLWLKTKSFANDDSLVLLSDGRYQQVSYYDFSGGVSSFVTEGLYTLQGEQLTLDPVCDGPSSYTLKQVQNHLLLSFPDTNNTPVTLTYIAAPPTSVAYQLGQIKLNDEATTQANTEWEGRIPLAPINMNLGRAPVSGEISADPNPGNRFEGATVFAEQEVYPYTSEYFYVYDTSGNYIQTSPSLQIIENMGTGPVRDIDFSRGQFHDKLNTYFFPNGRTLTYFENYSAADITGYEPKPVITYTWGKYKIEENLITIESDAGETFAYELLYGRRKIRSGEACYDNLEYASHLAQ